MPDQAQHGPTTTERVVYNCSRCGSSSNTASIPERATTTADMTLITKAGTQMHEKLMTSPASAGARAVEIPVSDVSCVWCLPPAKFLGELAGPPGGYVHGGLMDPVVEILGAWTVEST